MAITFTDDGALSYTPDADLFGPGETAHTVIGTVYMPGRPKDTAIDAQTNRIYVTIVSNGSLTVIDGETGKVINVLWPMASHIEDVALNPVTDRIYVTGPRINQHINSTTALFNGVYVYDETTLALLATIPIAGNQVEDVAVNVVTDRIYVASLDNDSVSAFYGPNNGLIAIIPVGTEPRQLAVDPRSNRVFALSTLDGTVTLIDGVTSSVVATVGVGADPRFLLVDEERARVYVTSFADDSVAVIDQVSNAVIHTIPVGAGPQGMALDPTTGLLYVANSESDSVTVIDRDTGVVVNTITVGAGPESVTVNPLSESVYVANRRGDTVSVIDAATGTVTATVPVGHDPATLTVNPITDRVYTVDVGSHTVSVIHVGDHFTYKVSDGDLDSNVATVTLVIEPENLIPKALDDYYRVDMDGMLDIPAPGVFSNDAALSGEPLTAVLVSEPASGSLSLNADGSFTYTPIAGFSGTVLFTYMANDGAFDSNVATVTILVQQANRAPFITSIPILATRPEQEYKYEFKAIDPDGDNLTYSLPDAPPGMVIYTGSGLILWTPDPWQVGSHDVIVRVEDPFGAWASQDFTLVVSGPNSSPQIISAPVTTAAENHSYIYNVEAIDADGDTLSYELITAPDGMTINADTGLIAWTPSREQIGLHSVYIEVTDGRGGTDSQSFTVAVVDASQVNHPPVIISTPLTAATVDQAYSYDVEAVDTDGDTLIFSLTVAPDGMTIDSASGLIRWTPTHVQVGDHPVAVRVEDSGGLSASQSFRINDTTPHLPPVAVDDVYEMLEGEQLFIAGLPPVKALVAAVAANNPVAQKQAAQNYGRLPLAFEENQGQTDPRVKFLSRGEGYTLFLTAEEAVLALKPDRVRLGEGTMLSDEPEEPANLHVLRLKLLGANTDPKASGLDTLPGKSNYFIGDDPSRWRTGVSTYRKVAFDAVYPGIDLVYYGNQHQLEYDFVVAPGADPDQIRLAVEGADQVSVDEMGNLVLDTPNGEIRQHKPVVYQEVDGERQRLDGRYVLLSPETVGFSQSKASTVEWALPSIGGSESAPSLIDVYPTGDLLVDHPLQVAYVGFELAEYDHEKPLVIDPVLVYSTYLGGGQLERGAGIAVDTQGSTYIVGHTNSLDFPITAGAWQPTKPGGSRWGTQADAFITKLAPDGSTMLYSTYLGGTTDIENARGVAVDGFGYAHVVGITWSADFPVTAGAYIEAGNAFVTKLGLDGSSLVYSSIIGGYQALDIALDVSGNAYVTGDVFGNGIQATPNAAQPNSGGGRDAYVVKLDSTGSSLLYATYLGGAGGEEGVSLAIDGSGKAYITGWTTSSDFPLANPIQAQYGGGGALNGDAFVVVLNAHGTQFDFATYLGGARNEAGMGIAVDGAGNAFVTGNTASADFPLQAPLQPVFGGFESLWGDAFVTKIDTVNHQLVFSTYLGGSADDAGYDIEIDVFGNSYVAGATDSADFPLRNPIQATFVGGSPNEELGDVFLAKIDPAGSQLRFSTYLGGGERDHGECCDTLTVDACGDAYLTGTTFSWDFPTQSPLQEAPAGKGDVYVTKVLFDDVSDISVTKSDMPDPVIAGNELRYTLTVSNLCDKVATDVTLTDVLPPEITLISATPTQGSCTEAAGNLNCELGELAGFASAEVTLVTTVNVGEQGIILNQTSVVADQEDLDPSNNSATAITNADAVGGVLVNDYDPDGDPITAVWVAGSTHGDVTLDRNGTFTYTPAADFSGTDTFTYKANDGELDSNIATVYITVKAVNHPPTITSMPITKGTVRELYTYDVESNDADGDTLNYILNTAPAGMTIDAATGLLNWIPSEPQTGLQNVQVQVTDGLGGTDNQSFSVYVDVLPNNPPEITSSPVEAVATGEPYTYDVEATDPDGDTLSYRLKDSDFAGPTDVAVDINGDLIVVDPNAFSGAGAIFRVDPTTGEQSVISMGGDFVYPIGVAIEPDGNLIVVDQNAFGGSGGVIRVDPVSGAQTMVSSGGHFVTPTGVAVAVDGAIIVTDGNAFGGSGGVIAVDPITGNQAEVSSGGDFKFPTGVAIGPTGLLYIVDRNTLYSGVWITPCCRNFQIWVEVMGAVIEVDPLTGNQDVISSRGMFNYLWGIQVAANGDLLITDHDFYRKAIYRVDPVSGNQSVVSSGDNLSLPFGIAVDESGKILVADFDALDGAVIKIDPDDGTQGVVSPARIKGMSIDETTGLITWTPSAAQGGSHDVTVEVSDRRGGSDTQAFFITVDDGINETPLITTEPPTAAVAGHPYTYAVDATDPDGDTLIYSLPTAPSGMIINPSSGLIEWTPSTEQAGSHDVTVRVEDSFGASASQGFTLVVGGPNNSPQIASIPPGSPKVGQLYTYDVEASDLDGDTLTYSLPTAPAGMTIDPASGLIQWTPAAGQVGDNDVVVRVDDGRGGFATQGFTLTVALAPPVNEPPVITSDAVIAARARQLYSYDVQANDPNLGDTLTYSLDNAPAGMIIDPPSGLIQWVPIDDQVGDHSVTVRVTDDGGLFDTQGFTITVAPGNQAPDITSLPSGTARVGLPYSYVVEASDPDAGDTLTFFLDTAPAGMTIDAASGLVQWTPTPAQVGNQAVTVGVQDQLGAGVLQGFNILVAANQPPVITSTPVIAATAGQGYSYDVEANDPDGDTLTYSLTTAPVGMAIDPETGLIQWTPTEAQVGDHPVTVRVQDLLAAETQDFTITVAEAPPPVPELASIRVTPEAPLALTGQAIDFAATGIRADGTSHGLAGLATWESSDSTVATIDANGRAVTNAEGSTTITARIDAVSSSILLTVVARMPNGTPPVVEITSPAEGATITGPVPIIGTASDPELLKYVLDIAPVGTAGFTTIAEGTTSITNGELGTLDPTLLFNDLYTLRLTVFDRGGFFVQAETQVQVAREQKVGNFTLAFQDVSVPMACMPITVTRVYDSRDKDKGDFGVGWRLDVKTLRLRESDTMGENWAIDLVNESGPFGIQIPTYVLYDLGTHKVSLTLPGGQVEEFDLTPQPNRSQWNPIYTVTPVYTPRPGTLGSLAADGAGILDTFGATGHIVLYDADLATFDPRRYRYTTPEGNVYLIDKYEGVKEVQCTNGQTLTFTPDGIEHSGGKGAVFTRDDQGRITAITDPAGNVHTYTYDANGDLASYTDPETNATGFKYDYRHGMLEIIDPRGVRAIRNEYDDEGRLISTTDPKGSVVTFDHDLVARTETITDRLGNATLYEYDEAGNVLRETDPLGNVTTHTYDAFGNEETRTDPLGRTTTMTYDLRRNMLSESDPLGNATAYSYTALNAVRTITDPLGRVTTNDYDIQGNLLTTTDPLGNTTSHDYDDGGTIISGSGNLLSTTDALGNITRYGYDNYGNLTRETDALGSETTYTYDSNGNRLTETHSRTLPGGAAESLVTWFEYDANNRLVKSTRPDASTTLTEYNAIGKQARTIDALGRQTLYEYDEAGRSVRTIYPDGAEESTTYDAEGRRLSSIDRAGRVTSYAYDALGRLVQTTFPDGITTATSYDATGQVVTSTDALGNVTRYEYDAAGRRARVIDALGNQTTFTYDDTGNQTRVTDANGNSVQFEYDNNNRRGKTIHADGTIDQVAYDAVGRHISKTDQAGVTTQYEYDALGRLVKVIDALGQETRYGYDEQGNQVSQTDANGNATAFDYDALGRRVSRTLPLGMAETMAYNAVSNLTSKTDFNGRTTTYVYDTLNRPIEKRPDPATGEPVVRFTYNASGQRASMEDASGTTTYSYDVRNRLIEKATPQGTLSYIYDVTGNLLSIQSGNSGGASMTYAYDALNRLSSVTDANGATTYVYDAVGNLASYTYPNGVEHGYTYNALNRLIELEVTSGAVPIASYSYNLGPSGNRLSVAEISGRRADYNYDGLYRLTGETVTGDPDGVNGSVGYDYDPVGNRLARTSTLAPVPAQTFGYDANDRITTEVYDDSGNTLETDGRTFGYDSDNRLTTADGGVSFVYDGDGNRVARTVGGVTTGFLVDTLNPTGYSQVLEEIVNDAVVRRYTYGLDLVSQEQSTGVSFYGYDGHGSVRLLTDAVGGVTDRYGYDAFGKLSAQTYENNWRLDLPITVSVFRDIHHFLR